MPIAFFKTPLPSNSLEMTIAHINMAVIKYWGKRDVDLNLPLNSSLSVTLDSMDDTPLHTETHVTQADSHDELVLDDHPTSFQDHPRLKATLARLKQLYNRTEPLRITTKNHGFPTSSGLASSASGLAAFVVAIARYWHTDGPLNRKVLAEITRQGSGSACRSLYGGFVAWHAGTQSDGSDSLPEQVSTCAILGCFPSLSRLLPQRIGQNFKRQFLWYYPSSPH